MKNARGVIAGFCFLGKRGEPQRTQREQRRAVHYKKAERWATARRKAVTKS
jgi:hypothetical protein